MENGKAIPKVIQVGLDDGRNTQVVSGLNPGDVVVSGLGSVQPAAGAGQAGQRPGGGAPFGGGGRFGG